MYELAHLSIHQICELLKQVKGTNLQIQKLHDLHDTGQQYIQGEHRESP